MIRHARELVGRSYSQNEIACLLTPMEDFARLRIRFGSRLSRPKCGRLPVAAGHRAEPAKSISLVHRPWMVPLASCGSPGAEYFCDGDLSGADRHGESTRRPVSSTHWRGFSREDLR